MKKNHTFTKAGVNSFASYKEYITYCSFNNSKESYEKITNFQYDINGESLKLEMPSNYENLISKIKNQAESNLDSGVFTKEKRGLALKVSKMLDCNEVIFLGEHLAKELSKKLYGSEVVVEHVHVYKNLIKPINLSSSWLWHYDNCSPGQLKILIYLTDVGPDSGCFEFMVDGNDKAFLFKSSKVSPETEKNLSVNTRIDNNLINDITAKGFKSKKIIGKAGTYIIFNQNIIHRANVPILLPERICIVYNFRPYYKNVNSRINKNITCDWDNPPPTGVKIYQYEL